LHFAKTGINDEDTLETLSDQLDDVPTAAGNADAIWNEATSGHVATGTFGKLFGDICTAMSTLLARVGTFTGAGVNTILGCFRALLNKAASNPSDVGGTFDAATDSTEALRDNQQPAAQAAIVANNLDHLMKNAVGNNANMTTEVPDGTVLSNMMTKTGDTSDYDPSTDSLEGLADRLAAMPTAGSGSVETVITLTENGEAGGTAVADADVWVTSDEEGTVIVVGTLQSDSEGQVTVYLDPGTYYVFAQKDGWTGITGDELVVEEP